MAFTQNEISGFNTTQRLLHDLLLASGSGGGSTSPACPCPEPITKQMLANMFLQPGTTINVDTGEPTIPGPYPNGTMGLMLQSIMDNSYNTVQMLIAIRDKLFLANDYAAITANSQPFILNHLQDVKALQQVTNDTLSNITNQLQPIQDNVQRLRELADRPSQVHVITGNAASIETSYPAWISKNNVEVQDVKFFEIAGQMQVFITYRDLA